MVSFKTNDEGIKAFEAGRCDSFTTDASGLAAERLRFASPGDYIILPELISREPLGPAVRRGDENFAALVRWTHFAMLNAEDLGVTRANVEQMRATTTNPEIRRLLGTDGKFGETLGLTNDWAYGSSAMSETTPRASTAMSAPARASACPVAPKPCGARAGCNIPIPSADAAGRGAMRRDILEPVGGSR